MCGIVGVAGDLKLRDEALMKRLFLLDYFRGPDSTGLAAIRESGTAFIAKLSSHPLDLFDMSKFRTALNGAASTAFIGHNRSATRGSVNNANAHPFQFGHIVGVHNGTLDFASCSRLDEALGRKFEVDSEALFAGFAELGVKATIGLLSEGRDYQTGAWSLVWYDAKENTLNFLRNKHRPMWYAFTKEYDRLIYASEWGMIQAAKELSVGTELAKEGKEGHSYFTTEPDIWYSYDVAELVKGGTTRPKAKARELKGREPLPVVSHYGKADDPFPNRVGFHSSAPSASQRTGGIGSTGSGSTSQTTGSVTKKANTVHLLGTTKNPWAGMVSKESFSNYSKFGCSWCQKPVDYADSGITVFERDGVVICGKCLNAKAEDTNRIYVSGKAIDALL